MRCKLRNPSIVNLKNIQIDGIENEFDFLNDDDAVISIYNSEANENGSYEEQFNT